jgi:actin-like ATPase involved in cell morphogenesis
MDDWVLSIDFGTTSTAAAIQVDGSVERIELDGAPRMPSMVFWREGAGAPGNGRLVVGQEADELSGVAPWCLERTPKRRIADETIRLGDQELRVVEVIGAVLRRVSEEALAMRGGHPPAQVRLTHPARWSRLSLDKLRRAAEVAGLTAPVFVPEPVAAATHFASARLKPGQHVAVYDLGGGTFDTAVLRRTDDSFELQSAPGGDEGLGGEDFDDRLYRYLGRQLSHQKWQSLRESTERVWMQANREFLRNARRTKEFLSRSPQYEFYMPPPIDQELLATAETFKELIAQDVQSTVAELERTVRAAGLEPHQLAAVYLAGGSSRIPLIAQTIERRLGLTPQTWDDPKAVTVLGAARLSAGAASASEAATPAQPAAAASTALETPPAPATVAATTERAIAPAAPTAAGPRRPSPRPRRPTPSLAVTAFIVALLSLGAGALGYVLAPKRSGGPASFTAAGRTTAGPITMSWPRGWSQAVNATVPNGIAMDSEIALTPGSPPGAELIAGTRGEVLGSLLLPRQLLRALPSQPSPASVHLGQYEFFRYAGLNPAGAPAMTAYALPTSGPTVLAFCLSPTQGVGPACDGIMATLHVTGNQVLPLGPNAIYAAGASSAFARLGQAIQAANLSGAATPADQAAAAGKIGTAYRSASTALQSLQGAAGPGASGPNVQLTTWLSTVGTAFAGLASAASSGDAAAYAQARAAIDRGNAVVNAALSRLAVAGYRLT